MTTRTRALATAAALATAVTIAACTSDDEDTASNTTPANEAQTTDTAANIPGSAPDPRCETFDVNMLAGILNDDTLTPTNGQVINDGDNQWIGATLMRADGKMESRSDVWLLNGDGLFSVTGGARNNTWAAAASKVGYSAGDEHAQAVDNCVVTLTRNGSSPTAQGTAPDPTSAPEAAPVEDATPAAAQQPTAPTATCATDFTLYQPGTVFYSDGTSGYSAACQQQMEDAMEASGQFPDYPFGQVDPNWTEEDAMRGGTAGNAETGGAATPADCDGFQGAHEDSEALYC